MGRKPVGEIAMSGAERMRRLREKRGTDKPKPDKTAAAAPLQARIAELEARLAERDAELAQAKARINERLASRFGGKRAEAKPKPEKPPLPPDEERDRIIKGLRTRVRHLMSEVHHMRAHAEDVQSKTGGIDFRTTAAIAKCIFPDQRNNATDADKDAATKLFTQFLKADKDNKRRAR